MIIALVVVAPAMADPIGDYRNNGSINPCKYSEGQLQHERDNLPPDVQQYAPGLADQLNAGREGCGGSSPGSANTRRFESVPAPGAPGNGGSGSGSGSADGTSAGASADAAKPAVPAPPAPSAAQRVRLANISSPAVAANMDKGAPGWLAPLLLALLAGALVAAVVRMTGVATDRVGRPLRAAFGDAGGRTADSFAELWDRVRLGR